MKALILSLLAIFMVVLAVPARIYAAEGETDSNATTAAEDDSDSESAGGTEGAKQTVCEGLGITGGNCDEDDNSVGKTLKTAINLFSFVVGIIAVIMIIIGGLKYVTSMGDSSSVNSAKNTILYAVIGLVVVALSQILVFFVVNKIITKDDAAIGGVAPTAPSGN